MGELIVNPGQKELATFRDVVVIRPPSHIPKPQLNSFITKISNKGFLPIVLPHRLKSYDPPDDKWFPTDDIREVDSKIFVNGGSNFERAMKPLRLAIGNGKADLIESRVVNFPLNGGNYLHNERGKIFVYAADKLEGRYIEGSEWYIQIQQELRQRIDELQAKGWRVYPTTIEGRETNALQDLDFLLSIFSGRDGRVHAIAAESFSDRVPEGLEKHVIPDEEAAKGGCNIADLRRGSTLVAQNFADIPLTGAILEEYASADIIQTPRGFLEGGGGPRCSISSFSLS